METQLIHFEWRVVSINKPILIIVINPVEALLGKLRIARGRGGRRGGLAGLMIDLYTW